uniref:Uncharacterized protein n=1 Tax=Rhizophora mucronata TaxID=61149 RepID=A0A2P2KSZ5_RHIMU
MRTRYPKSLDNLYKVWLYCRRIKFVNLLSKLLLHTEHFFLIDSQQIRRLKEKLSQRVGKVAFH